MTDRSQDPFNLADLTIVAANQQQDDAHTLVCHTFDAWGDGMTLENFQRIVHREETEGGWMKDNGGMTWVLVRRDDVAGEIFAGCETHRTKAMIKRKESKVVDECWMYGVTSVITPAGHRGKGYASHLMRLLHYILGDPSKLPPFPSQWGTLPVLDADVRADVPLASVSTLWSDIGADFYARCTTGDSLPGWIVNPQHQDELIWKLRDPSGDDEGWEMLYAGDMLQVQEVLHPATTAQLLSTDTTEHGCFVPDPASQGTLDFVPLRGLYGLRKYWPNPEHEEPRGIRRGETIILFARHNYQVGNRLLITYVYRLSPPGIPSALRALDRAGGSVGVNEGWAWGLGLDGELVNAWKAQEGRDVIVGLRAGAVGSHLLGLAWYEGDTELADRQMWHWL